MRILVSVAVLAVTIGLGPGFGLARSAATPALAHAAGPTDPPEPGDPTGDPEAMPDLYDWLGPINPSDTYHLAMVRGMRPRAVLRMIGPVRRRLDGMTPRDAEGWKFEHMDRHYNSPLVVQVAPRGRATFVFVPYDFLSDESFERISRRGGKVVAFTTTVEYDTYLSVFRRGKLIRSFDAGFRPPREGALPQEAGLDWGDRHQNIWATAWAFIERVTLTHIEQGVVPQRPPDVRRQAPLPRAVLAGRSVRNCVDPAESFCRVDEERYSVAVRGTSVGPSPPSGMAGPSRPPSTAPSEMVSSGGRSGSSLTF